MADARVPLRGLWRALRKAEFRSPREKVGYYVYTTGAGLLIIVSAVYFEPFDSRLYGIGVALVVLVAQLGGWSVWLTWGRQRFPLASADESPAS